MVQNNVESIIVTYNPEILRLLKNLESVTLQVSRVIIVDNNSKNSADIKVMSQKFKNVSLISLADNEGIATALNVGISNLEKNTKWVLTLDQDSVIPLNMINKYWRHTTINRLAILSPVVIDERRYNKSFYSEKKIDSIKQCIQSGSMFNVSILKELGRFNSWLFIDYVDYDYCYKAIESGYKIYRVNDVVLNQEFGELHDSKFKSFYDKLWRLTNISLFKKLTYYPEISPLRNFYTIRNRIYCMKYVHGYRLFKEICLMPIQYLKVLFRGKQKKLLIKSIYSGTKEGIKWHIHERGTGQ